MKPTPQQAMQWWKEAHDSFNVTADCVTALAELAAQWGASQAQQTTEPELPEAVAWRFVDDEEAGYTSYRDDRPAETQVAYLKQWNRPAWEPLYTPAQMHDYAAAKVREAMAQQAIQRGIDKILADPEKHGLDLGEKQ